MEIINSFFSNVKGKMTNPFFGTLILVLIFHHWELIYALFNFNKDLTLDIKLTFIKTYISDNITFDTFWQDAFWALLFMFSGYFIIVLTRGIVLWMDYWLMPFITGKIINKKVVLKDDYDIVVSEREDYFDKYEELRKIIRNFSKTIDKQIKQIRQKNDLIDKQTNTISAKNEELHSTKINLQNCKDDEINQFRSVNEELSDKIRELEYKTAELMKFNRLFFDNQNQSFYSSLEKFPPEVINNFNSLKKENKLMDFIETGNYYKTGGTLSPKIKNEMVQRGLLFRRRTSEDLTPVGKIIYHYQKIFLNN